MKSADLRERGLLRLLPTVAFLAAPGAALAQAVPPPQQALPSREEVQPPAPAADVPKSQINVRSDDDRPAPCPLSKFDLEATISTVQFTGHDGAPLPAEVADLLAPVATALPSGPQRLQAVCDIRDAAGAALRRGGYVASVQIPPQRLEGGALRLEVITAHIVEVRVRGEAGPYRDTVAARIEKLKALNPLRKQDAERILLLADDVPGLDVQLSLRPAGTVPGEVIGDLTVSYRRIRLLANVQNYGSRQLGRETGYVRAEYYGLTGASDMTWLGVQTTFQTNEQQVIQGGHMMGIGSSGLTASAGITYAWSRPDVGTLDLRSRSLLARFEVKMPLIRSVRRDLTVSGGFDFADQRTRVARSALNRDRISTFYARIDGALRDPRPDGSPGFSLNGGVEVRQGVDIFGATQERSIVGGYTPSRFEGSSVATVIRADVRGSVPLGRIFTLGGTALAQWADRPLLNFDEFSIGNLTIGRGYDPGANSGDRGIGLHGELAAKIYESPRFRLDLFGFYDSVWLYNLDTGSIENNRRLGSFGGGGRFLLRRYAYVEASYARPEDPALLLPNARRSPPRFLLSLTLQFAPGSR